MVEAKVANQDVGRLRPGMPATVKVRAFDYLRFGTLDGVLQKVAADATPDPRTGELAYAVTVVTDAHHLGAARRARRGTRAWWSTSTRKTAASGQLEAMAMRMRRTLRVTRAPIFRSFRRMVPQVAVASSVPARPMRRRP